MHAPPKQINTRNGGSVLITVLAVMVMVSLGVGVSLMVNTSSVQVAEKNVALRSRGLAQAGFRYASTEYLKEATLSGQLDRLASLHQETVTLLDNNGSFQLSVYPFFFVARETAGAASTLTLQVPGKFPDGFGAALPARGMVNIGLGIYDYEAGFVTPGATAFDPDRFTITLSGENPVDITRNDRVLLTFAPSATETVTQGGNITIFSSSELSDLFPPKNGLLGLFLDDHTDSGTYRYRERQVLENGSVRLTGITGVEDSSLPLTLDTTSRIVLKKQAAILTSGQIGEGGFASGRSLDLHVFLTDQTFQAQDTTEDLALGDGGSSVPDTFGDTGTTKLENWEFDNTDNTPENELITTTTQLVSTAFDDPEQGPYANFLTFQNFAEEDQDKGYTMDVVDKEKLPESVRNTNLNGLWGNAADNIYFVGDDGTILHYDGTDYTLENTGFFVPQDLNAIWGLPEQKYSSDETDYIFVVGDDGMALINQGHGWVRAVHNESYDIYAAYGTAWSHFDGYGQAGTNPYNWDSADTADRLSNYSWYINEFDGKANFRCLWAVNHTYPYRTNYGAGSSTVSTQNVMVGEFSADDRVAWFWQTPDFRAGDGIIMHEFYEPAVVIPGVALRGVWGSAWDNIYVVGDNGSIFQNTAGDSPDYGTWPYPGWSDSWQGGWVQIPSSRIPTTENLNGVYGNSATDFYVIGDNGTLLYNKGDGFELVPTNGVTSEDLNAIWGSDRTGIYAVGDNGTIVFLGYPLNKIGGYILPLSRNASLAAKWQNTEKHLSYTIQVKTVWGEDLEYAASGICFRWHKVEEEKYAGYGVSFVRFDSSNDGSLPNGSNYNDMIPDAIKPYFNGIREQHDRLLVLLWEQYVQDSAEQLRWIAYKDISADTRLVKANGTPVDLSALVVRVHEKTVDGVKVNDIDVYYANPSMEAQAYDTVYNNIIRHRYNATFGQYADPIKWPVSDLDQWTGCPNLGVSCASADAFTLVDNVSVEADPVAATTSKKYWIVNPATEFAVLKNGHTIRASRFTSPDGTSFGSQSDRSEIGVHVFGDIGDSGTRRTVSFTDFAVQLGVDAAAVDMGSSFSSP